jgi:putative N6-adenine-specific DNA methylase
MKFFVTCAKGTEGPLRRELADLRIRGPRGEAGGVSFEGTFAEGMKACLWSRVAMRVLLEVGAFEARNAEELYAGARAVDWHERLDARHTFAVSATAHDNPALQHSGFAALKVKDAVVDALRDRLGARPDVSVDDPDVSLHLHLRGPQARLFLDLAGEPLHRRGYRVAMTEAPLKETLAAAMLALGSVPAELPFVDPMTGSGTLAIEHALRARRLAPGLRRRFGFERWPSQAHAPAWKQLREEALALALPRAPAPILGRDAAEPAIAAARRNAEAAGVGADIRLEVGAIAGLDPREPAGTLCVNPPYGERLAPAPARFAPPGRRPARPPAAPEGPDRALHELYEEMGRLFARLPGWRIVVLSGSPIFSRVVLRKANVSHRLWNGPLEVRLLVYEERAVRSPR